ncbi:hypothetical protein [Candidatus Pelagibacter sp. HIMB1623]|uniref:hypothetical protein n=1 Tax=Candidatus Pelagibacter sp. HIMB1623 TaxID=3413358 RepID=UPI003F8493B4
MLNIFNHYKLLIIFLFTLIVNIQSNAISAINEEEIKSQISLIERNLKEYEITKSSNLLDINDNLIKRLTLGLEEESLDNKILLFQELSDTLTSIKANVILKIIEKDAKNNGSLKNLNNQQLKDVTQLFEDTIPNIYDDTRETNDNAYLLASILNESEERLCNNIVKQISNTSIDNNNSNSLATNVIYFASEINSEFLSIINKTEKEKLIKQSINEVNYDLNINKKSVEKKISKDNYTKNSLVALSTAILKSSEDISNNIIQNINNLDKKDKEVISFKLTEQSLELDEWKKSEDLNIINNKVKFAENIFSSGFSKIDDKKIELAKNVIEKSDVNTSEILVRSIIDTHIKEENNFFTLEENVVSNLSNIFEAAKVNKAQIFSSNSEADEVLDSLFNNKLSSGLLKNNKLQSAYVIVPKKRFDLDNVSPN